jgi:hypothetical protein
VSAPAFENPRAEEARLRYLYRNLILRGRLRLPREAALPLVGPDCAFHLYGFESAGEGRPSASQPRRR